MWQLAVYSGCRLGEVIPLKWSDIDLRAGTVSIRRGQVQIGRQVIVSEPMTARSRRTIKLPQVAVQALVDHRARMLVEGLAGNPLVFIDEAGGMTSRKACRSSWERIRKLTKLPTLRIHDLRHTNASRLLSAGVRAKVVSERLGHSTISLMLDTYSHVVPSLQEEAADKLSEVLKRG
jgi:integrase